jgi:hypothetical protein
LKLNAPKKGDVYVGDNFDFLIGKQTEQILHGLRDRYGDPVYQPAIGEGSYKLTIVIDCLPYYIAEADALVYATHRADKAGYKWLKRTQNRRIHKHIVLDMILDGRLKKV